MFNLSNKTLEKEEDNLVKETVLVEMFVDLVKKSIENEEFKKKISITLTPEVTSVISNIITLTPNTLTDIEKSTIQIINDGKIDSKDIPNLIVVIKRIYQFIYSLENCKFDTKKRVEITATSLKYLIHLLVIEKKIKIDEEKREEFFTQTNALIDSCVDLLSFSKSLKTKRCKFLRI
jgi:hypothetical protein